MESGSVVFLKSGANLVGATKGLSISGSNKLIDTTTKENDWKTYKYGRSSWSGSVSGLVDIADVGQKSLFDAVMDGSDLSIVIGKETPATGDPVFSGSCQIDKNGEAYAEGSDSTLDVSFRGNGPLQLTITA